jgi:hypothetical protein
MHKPAPYISVSSILNAKQDNSLIDSDDIAIYPKRIGIECIDKTITAVNLLAKFFSHSFQDGQREFGREHV